MPTCSKCKAVLPIEEFYRHSRYLSGHRSDCKKCVKAYSAKPDRVAARKAYQASHPEVLDKGCRKWAKANPEKKKAHWTINNALRRGLIVKPKACEQCGKEGRVEAHHEDYAQPLVVIWLCPKHHRGAHGK